MKKQKKLTIKVRDLAPLNNVRGGRRGAHAHGLQARAFAERGEGGGRLGSFAFRSIQ